METFTLSTSIIMILIFMSPIVFMFSTFYKAQFKIFIKVFAAYILIALLFIAIFAMIYTQIFNFDIKFVVSEYPDINKLGDAAKYSILNDNLHFKGLDYSAYKNNKALIFIDMFYFSTMTFLSVGYGDITITGYYRVLAIIESLIGIGWVGLFISLAISTNSKKDAGFDIIKAKIFRGSNVLHYRITSTRLCEVFLLDINRQTSYHCLRYYNYEIKNFIEGFLIKWDFRDPLNQNFLYYANYAIYLTTVKGIRSLPGVLKLYEFYNISSESELKAFANSLEELISDFDPEQNSLDDYKDYNLIKSAIYSIRRFDFNKSKGEI